MWILTIDQIGSRRVGDRVEVLLADLTARGPLVDRAPASHHAAPAAGLVLPFERTVGDEVQAVVSDPALAVEVALHVLDLGGWSVGIGAGRVDLPLPASSRAASGPAFVHARAAVEAAKSRGRTVPLVVRADAADLAAEAEAVLTLLAVVAARRTSAGREVIDRVRARDGSARQEEIAADLGISQQAVSERLRTALWAEERAARPAAARLLRLAAGSQDDGVLAAGPGGEGTSDARTVGESG